MTLITASTGSHARAVVALASWIDQAVGARPPCELFVSADITAVKLAALRRAGAVTICRDFNEATGAASAREAELARAGRRAVFLPCDPEPRLNVRFGVSGMDGAAGFATLLLDVLAEVRDGWAALGLDGPRLGELRIPTSGGATWAACTALHRDLTREDADDSTAGATLTRSPPSTTSPLRACPARSPPAILGTAPKSTGPARSTGSHSRRWRRAHGRSWARPGRRGAALRGQRRSGRRRAGADRPRHGPLAGARGRRRRRLTAPAGDGTWRPGVPVARRRTGRRAPAGPARRRSSATRRGPGELSRRAAGGGGRTWAGRGDAFVVSGAAHPQSAELVADLIAAFEDAGDPASPVGRCVRAAAPAPAPAPSPARRPAVAASCSEERPSAPGGITRFTSARASAAPRR